MADDFGFDEFEPEVPQVLTPVRLQQPLAEVPASVSVITAEQISAWGATDITDVLRFVPGLFVSDDIDSSRSNVVYHSGEASFARRLEVLVDGRSVYRAAFATVDWQQLNIALEDIQRIEVTRGPSAASYGRNAFQGVIHIITRHPADSQLAEAAIYYGSQQRRHGYFSVSNQQQQWQNRLSIYADREGEFGGYHANSGELGGLPDLSQMKGLDWSSAYSFSESNEIRWQLGRQQIFRDALADSNLQPESRSQEIINDDLWLRWRSQLSDHHELQLQAYWQAENREDDSAICAPTMLFDPLLAELAVNNVKLAEQLGRSSLALNSNATSAAEQQQILQTYQAIAAAAVSREVAEAQLKVAVSDQDMILMQNMFANMLMAGGAQQIVCGDSDADIYQQRADIELQDTVRWNEQWRSVQGISYRRDDVDSNAYFSGRVKSEQWLAFVNTEYRASDNWLWSGSVLLNHDRDSDTSVSPRLAVNYLLSAQQSIRFQYARSQRSPDLAERYLNGNTQVRHLTQPNYLNSSSAELFIRPTADSWKDQLKDEEIQAWELGYFAYWPEYGLQLDGKLFHEKMRHLIKSRLNLLNPDLSNGGDLINRGIELQLSWEPVRGQQLWANTLLQSRHADSTPEVSVGNDRSLRMMWTGDWSVLTTNFGFIYDDDAKAQDRDTYRQQRLLGHLIWKTGFGDWSLRTEYDLLADNPLHERQPDWLVWTGYRASW